MKKMNAESMVVIVVVVVGNSKNNAKEKMFETDRASTFPKKIRHSVKLVKN